MAKDSRDIENAIARQAEGRMRAWDMSREIEERIAHERTAASDDEVHPYLAISREAGAGGSELARLTAQKLGWRLLDRELLVRMAQTYHVPESELESIDEKSTNWFSDIFAHGWDRRFISQVEYVRHLEELIMKATHEGSAVIVGRGAQFFLPREKGLRIRLIAPLSKRVARMAETYGLDRRRAREFIERTDKEYAAFIARYFHHDVADPHLYDEIINTERLNLEEVADAVVALAREHFSHALRS
jgi:cytidylate kinase